MGDVFHVVLPMAPQQKGRPMGRVAYNRAGKAFVQMYTQAEARHWMTEAAMRLAGERVRGGFKKLGGPLRVTIVFVRARCGSRPVPSSQQAKDGHVLCSPERWKTGGRIPCGKLPDLDNYAKAALDAASKAGLWYDDGQVAELNMREFYAAKGERPSVEIRIEPL